MENLTLTSFIIKDKNYVIKDVNNIDEKYFTPITNTGEINAKKIDSDYIDGVIYLEFNENVIMDYTYWDDINDLWHYLINTFEELCQTNISSFSFPSQPIVVSIKIVNDRVLMSIGEKQMNINAKYFFSKMLDEAIIFFENLAKIFPRLAFEYNLDIERIEQIKQRLNEKFSNFN